MSTRTLSSTDIPSSTDILSHAGGLSDAELLARVKALTQREWETTAVLIVHLAVLDERRLYEGEGYSSLFGYCTQALHFSEHAAYGRIEAARAARKFPIILDLLAEGAVNLTTVTLLAQYLTAENHRELLSAATHKSKIQVEELIVALRPKPAVRSAIRRLPTPHQTAAAPATQPQTAPDLLISRGECLEPSGLGKIGRQTLTPARRALIEPLAPQRYKIQFMASSELCEKLRQAQDLLRHQIPDGDLEQVMDRALTALLEHLLKQKFATTNRPRRKANSSNESSEGTGAKGSNEDKQSKQGSVNRSRGNGARYIPLEVKRVVWERDGQQCGFVSETGHRCTERGLLEFHHVVPYSLGGQATAENIQLRCRAHNGYEAEKYFGRRGPRTKKESSLREPLLTGYSVSTLDKLGLDRVRFEPDPSAGLMGLLMTPYNNCGSWAGA